jgi:hypothetical protein
MVFLLMLQSYYFFIFTSYLLFAEASGASEGG